MQSITRDVAVNLDETESREVVCMPDVRHETRIDVNKTKTNNYINQSLLIVYNIETFSI